MKPFFSYYGAKYRLARHLGAPRRDHIIEPFAGSACYACYYASRYTKVTLVDANPLIANLWRYLIRATVDEIMALPIDIQSVDELHGVPQEAKHLIGFWFNHGQASPSIRRGNWARNQTLLNNFWGEGRRRRVAEQVDKIKHWTVIEGHYDKAPDIEAHWHIDPPYQRAGYGYKFNDLDYAALAEWCKQRKGFVQVCEHPDATWLPFVPFAITKGTKGKGRIKRHSGEGLCEFGEGNLSLFDNLPERRRSNGRNGKGNHEDSQPEKAGRRKPLRAAKKSGRNGGRAGRRHLERNERGSAGMV